MPAHPPSSRRTCKGSTRGRGGRGAQGLAAVAFLQFHAPASSALPPSSHGAPLSTTTHHHTHSFRYLRTLGAYENVKKSYEYCRGFVGVRTLAPVVEWVAEGTLSRVPVVKNLKEKDGETADGYPMLHGLDNRLAELLKHFDDYVRLCV